MSLDQLLFFLVLLAIPLLQQLVTAMRGRGDTVRQGAADAAAGERVAVGQLESARDGRDAFEGSTAPPLGATPVPDGVAGSARRGAVARPIPGGPPVRGVINGPGLPATAVGPAPALPAKPPRAIPNVIRAAVPRRRVALSREDLRTALVRMAILGPCRALEPSDSSPIP